MAERPTLFVIPASNAALAAMLCLRHKRIEYRRVDLPPGIHRGLLRLLGFRGPTVPAMRMGGERVQGSRAISAYLERVRPEPPLFPAGAERRAALQEVERWSEAELQPLVRRIQPYAVLRDRSSIRRLLEGSHLGMPVGAAAAIAAPSVWLVSRIHGSNERAAGEALARLPGLLDHVDGLIEDGLLDASAPSAADLHVASTIHCLLRFDDLRELIESRPAGQHARGLVPADAAHIGRVLPGLAPAG